MNTESVELPQEDLVDRIAGALPENIRADFYREIRHCRSLPENDEMLRILRIMQFLTLLTESVPKQIVVEREKLELLFTQGLYAQQKTIESNENYQRQLNLTLTRLPARITAGIQTETIVAYINDNLRESFNRSTIPETVKTLGKIAEQLNKATSEYAATTDAISRSYQDAAYRAKQAIHHMNTAISQAADTTKEAAEKLSNTFTPTYWAVLMLVSSLSFFFGLLFGSEIIPRWMR